MLDNRYFIYCCRAIFMALNISDLIFLLKATMNLILQWAKANVLKFLGLFHFLFANKNYVIRARSHEILVWIGDREDSLKF